MMLFRIGNLAQKDLLQLTRDVMILIMILVGPVLQLALIARATTQGFHHQPIVVVDQDRSALRRRLVEAFDNTGYRDPAHHGPASARTHGAHRA